MRKIMMTTVLVAGFACVSPALAQSSDAEANVDVSAEIIVGSPGQTITSNRTYEVEVDGGRRDSRSEVFDKALYKAAKKTLKKDHEWFRIIDKETEKETTRTESRSGASVGFEREPVRRCGLLGCTTEYRTTQRGRFDSGFPEREDTVYTVILEYEMGSGPVAKSDNVYDARKAKKKYR